MVYRYILSKLPGHLNLDIYEIGGHSYQKQIHNILYNTVVSEKCTCKALDITGPGIWGAQAPLEACANEPVNKKTYLKNLPGVQLSAGVQTCKSTSQKVCPENSRTETKSSLSLCSLECIDAVPATTGQHQ